ncbi:MAG: pyridoxal 5'-phosphate synthase [Pseudomonadota bacterium]
MNNDKLITLTGNPDLTDSGFSSPTLNPFDLFKQWLSEADRLHIPEPRALILSTVNAAGAPSSRVVLMKSFDETGVTFGTSSFSQKIKDIDENPHVAGTLWWQKTMQQINFKGTVSKMDASYSDDMFLQRTREAQAVAAMSHQSDSLINENDLRDQIEQLIANDDPITRPDTWHAYHIAITSIEFWHGSQDRFHKRLCYALINGDWTHQFLQP